MLIARRHLSRVVSMTVRHSLGPLHTQHSAKEYVFRLEQTQRQGFRHHVPKPDLRVLRGNSQAACEARTTLTNQVREAVGAQPDAVTYPRLRAIASQKALEVCGETRRSGRQPRLRTQAASDLILPLNNRCRELRRQKHDLQARLTTNPNNEQLLDDLDSVRTQHRDAKRQQRQLQRQLEKAKKITGTVCWPTTQLKWPTRSSFFRHCDPFHIEANPLAWAGKTPSVQKNGETTSPPSAVSLNSSPLTYATLSAPCLSVLKSVGCLCLLIKILLMKKSRLR